MILTTEGITFS
ncbi:hypothetical protein YPPY52_3934, partial [Yersinia pestis PY-52]